MFRLIGRKAIFLTIALFYLILNSPVLASAITRTDLEDVLNGWTYYASNEDALCGTNTGITPSGLAPNSKIYVLGDSITNIAKNDLTTAINDADFVVKNINADGGRAISSDTAPPGSSGLEAVAADSIVTEGSAKSVIGDSDVVVVALGTNSGNEDLNLQIPALVDAIRAAKQGVPIFWVNMFSGSKVTEKNQQIAANAAPAKSNYKIIDTTSAGIELSGDGIHPTAGGARTFAQTIVDFLKGPVAGSVGGSPNGATVGNVSKDGNPFHILTYPPITDEVGAAKSIDDYILSRAPTSPFVGLGSAFIKGGKENNVNPFLAVGHLQRENNFATAPSGWHTTTPPSYNAFGRSASQTQPHTIYTTSSGRERLVYQWPSWEASLSGDDNWFAYIRRGYLNVGSPYESPDFETYISHYAPNSDGNNEAAYIAGLLATIDALTAGMTTGAVTNLGDECEATGNPDQPAIPATGLAGEYIADCAANEGNAAIACTAINQLMGIPYSVPGRAYPTDPNPRYLDCSAFTSMALYRTFGTNLGHICSTDYLSNQYFERIDNIRDIQPGDFIGKGTGCASGGGGGHIGLVVSYDPATKKLITVEASSSKYLSGLRGIGGPGGYNVGLAVDNADWTYIWAVRYIGPKTLQPGAIKPL